MAIRKATIISDSGYLDTGQVLKFTWFHPDRGRQLNEAGIYNNNNGDSQLVSGDTPLWLVGLYLEKNKTSSDYKLRIIVDSAILPDPSVLVTLTSDGISLVTGDGDEGAFIIKGISGTNTGDITAGTTGATGYGEVFYVRSGNFNYSNNAIIAGTSFYAVGGSFGDFTHSGAGTDVSLFETADTVVLEFRGTEVTSLGSPSILKSLVHDVSKPLIQNMAG